jgi:hypothetical protein
MRNIILWQTETLMQTIKATVSVVLLAALSVTSGVEQSFAGVATPAAVTPALSSGADGAIDQVRWGGGWRGGGWRGGGWGWRGGWHRGWGGWGGGGWAAPYYGYYGGYGCWQNSWTPWGWRRYWAC